MKWDETSASCRSVQNLLSTSLLSINIQIKTYSFLTMVGVIIVTLTMVGVVIVTLTIGRCCYCNFDHW